jgi:hypothetical protein
MNKKKKIGHQLFGGGGNFFPAKQQGKKFGPAAKKVGNPYLSRMLSYLVTKYTSSKILLQIIKNSICQGTRFHTLHRFYSALQKAFDIQQQWRLSMF